MPVVLFSMGGGGWIRSASSGALLSEFETPEKWRMLKAPLLNSLGLQISVIQDRSERGAFNMFKKYVLKALK